MSSAGLQYSMADSTDSTGGDGMSIFLWVLVVILFVVFVSCFVKKLAVASGDDFKDDNTYDLGENEVGKLIQSNRRVCVLAYAPWCSHCRRMKPLFKKLSGQFKNTVFAQCDCEKHPNMARKLGVDAFPAFKVFNNSKQVGEHKGATGSISSLKEVLKKIGAK